MKQLRPDFSYEIPLQLIFITVSDYAGLAHLMGTKGFGCDHPHPFSNAHRNELFGRNRPQYALFPIEKDVNFTKDPQNMKKPGSHTSDPCYSSCFLWNMVIFHLEMKLYQRVLVFIAMTAQAVHSWDIKTINEKIKSNYLQIKKKFNKRTNYFFFPI